MSHKDGNWFQVIFLMGIDTMLLDLVLDCDREVSVGVLSDIDVVCVTRCFFFSLIRLIGGGVGVGALSSSLSTIIYSTSGDCGFRSSSSNSHLISTRKLSPQR